MNKHDHTPLIPVVLSGGSGSRLWPLSREHYPKQFLPLVGDNTLLQDTVGRVAGFAGVAEPIIVCNEAHRFLVAEQMQNIGQPTQSIILEPVGKNTAPAVAVAALQALKQNDNPVLMVLPADHIIRDVEALEAAVSEGYELAGKGKLITFGIVPSNPETGYGYIETGKEISASNTFEVKQFVEKPDQKTALNYVSVGNYLWNSGMFMFQARQYLQELELYEPDMFAACQKALNDAVHDLDFSRLNKQAFEASPANSIDYAVFEKTLNAAVIPLAAGWSDVGSWSSLWEACDKDEHGNVKTGETLPFDTQGSYLYSSGRLVTTMGIKDSIVVETADAVLVADKNRAQEVKSIVNLLQNGDCLRSVLHRKVFRPWGSYDCVDQGDRFQVKRIIVKPGATLSLQMHNHRAEHWVVVKGTARVTKGDEVLMLEENQSTFIPLGVKHRLENTGSISLEIIEIQSGSYLGEDDIVRFEDMYGRE